MENFTKTIHKRIAQFLNDATAVVIHSYQRYLGSDLPESKNDPIKEPEEFKKFHDAGRAAASHLETLLKLANATDDSEAKQHVLEESDKVQELQTDVQKALAEIDERPE